MKGCRAARSSSRFRSVAAGILGALAGSTASDFVRVPRVAGARDLPPRHHHGDPRRRRLDDRALRRRAADPRLARRDPAARAQRDHRDRGQELLPPRRRGPAAARTAAALFENVRTQNYSQGASTLTQQLARAIFLSPRKTMTRKINEALVAFEIERRYSKDQIFTMYANKIPLGHGNYGVEAASRYYFGKSVKDLKPARGGAPRRHHPAAGRPVSVPQPRARPPAALDGSAPDGRGRLHHGGGSRGRRAGAAPVRPGPPRRRSSLPISARRSASISRGPTGPATYTAAGCAWTRRSTRSSRASRRRPSAGASGASPAGAGSRARATCSPRGTRIPAPTWTRAGKARLSPTARR